MGIDTTPRRRPPKGFAHFRCHQCPDDWRPWRQGGWATAEKHARVEHGAGFAGEVELRERQPWHPVGDA